MLRRVRIEAVEDRIHERPHGDQRQRPRSPHREAADRCEWEHDRERVRVEDERVRPAPREVAQLERLLRPRLRVVEELGIADRPVDEHERRQAHNAGDVRKDASPLAAEAPREQRQRDARRDAVRELDERREAQGRSGQRETHPRESRREQQCERGRAERRRQRLGVHVEARVDRPLAVLPRAVTCDRAAEERPERPDRGGDEADRAAAGRVETREEDGHERDDVERKLERQADPERDVLVQVSDRASREQRQRPDERPPEDRGAARVLLGDVCAGDESEQECGQRDEPDPPLGSARPFAHEPDAEREGEQGKQREADARQPTPRSQELARRRVEPRRVAAQSMAPVLGQAREIRVRELGERDGDADGGEHGEGDPDAAHRATVPRQPGGAIYTRVPRGAIVSVRTPPCARSVPPPSICTSRSPSAPTAMRAWTGRRVGLTATT